MRKILALILTLVLVLTMAMTAFADETSNRSHDVTVTYQPAAAVYSVDVIWGSMAFTYTAPAEGTWNPSGHNYVGAQTVGTWSCETDANKITVTNHSNTEVKVALTYTGEADYAGITGSFGSSVLTVASAVGTEANSAPSASAYLKLAGELEENTERVTIGKITVALNQ